MKPHLYKAKVNGINFCASFLFLLLTLMPGSINADTGKPSMRRTISTQSPAWLIHIDTWVWPDPQKCIDLIPEDIRPYVIMNISLSVSDFVIDKYPFTIAESWLRTCAENGMWAMIQPSSGGPNNFSNTEMDVYEYFYANYSNFVGWNFCEQSWGFSEINVLLDDRIRMFVNLLELGNKYGGYLVVSHTQTMSTPNTNALAMLKRIPQFAEATKKCQDNYILCEKQTTTRGFYDMESTCLGSFLSGHAAHYGIRFDQCGWPTDGTDPFAEASGGIPIIEHVMLTGQTVLDGPELTWKIAILKDKPYTTPDGYTAKAWSLHPSFININIDIFRKMIDGTIHIPGREEVIERSKIAFVNDATGGNDRNKYSTEQSLFTGLYAMDGEWDTNNTWMKSTGRYPTIPAIYQKADYETGRFERIVTKNNYTATWPTLKAKIDEFNELFPEEYKGDIFAGRIHNKWVAYNPYMNNVNIAQGIIPFKYNTCDSLHLSFSPYSMAVIDETAGELKFYLNNFCTDHVYGQREDVIKIYGCTARPTFKIVYRGDRNAYSTTPTWDSGKGVYSLAIKHNGPLEITLNCRGAATDRLTTYLASSEMQIPPAPPVYTGPRQYEAENFDYKNISGIDLTALEDYTAMGYLSFGTSSMASIKGIVNVLKAGNYNFDIRYRAPGGEVNTIDIYANGTKVGTPTFKQTPEGTVWSVHNQVLNLKEGDNVIALSTNRKAGYGIYFDNFIITPCEGSGLGYDNIGASKVIVTTEYYNLNGVRIKDVRDRPKGVYIMRNCMEDGTVETSINIK